MKNYLGLFVGLVISMGSVCAFAEEKAPAPEEKSSIVAEAQEFSKGFDEMSQRHFTMMMSNYNLIGVTETVRGDVSGAVKNCGEKNPDMKKDLLDRHKAFEDALVPAMDEARQNVDNMIVAQSYAKPKKIKDFFEKMDAERKERDKEIAKVPVASKEACEFLLKTMAENQETLVKLLRSTLVSLPQVVQGEMEMKEKEAAGKEPQPAEAAEEKKPEVKAEEKPESAAAEKAPEETPDASKAQ